MKNAKKRFTPMPQNTADVVASLPSRQEPLQTAAYLGSLYVGALAPACLLSEMTR